MAGPQPSEGRRRFRSPMPGHPRSSCRRAVKTWMPGTRPGMTARARASRLEIQKLRRGAAEDVGPVVVAERSRGKDVVDGLQLPGKGIVAAEHDLAGADLGHQMTERL